MNKNKQGELLTKGLERADPNLQLALCRVCKGQGEFVQTYQMGYGVGPKDMMGRCEHCSPNYHHSPLGYGILQDGIPVSKKVFDQVMTLAMEA